MSNKTLKPTSNFGTKARKRKKPKKSGGPRKNSQAWRKYVADRDFIPN